MLDVKVDTEEAIKGLNWTQYEQVPFAAALGANNLAKMAQAEVRGSLNTNFTIAPERRAFLERTVRFDRKNYATKQNPAARMGINMGEGAAADSVGKKDRSFILGRHEEGGVRTARDPMHPFFLPSHDLRSDPFAVVPRSLYPTSLRIYERRSPSKVLPGKSRITSGGKVQRIGNRRTFVIDARSTSDPRTWGIWQRFGPNPEDIKPLWWFRQKIVLPPRLHFYATVERVIDDKWDEVFAAALERALRTAR